MYRSNFPVSKGKTKFPPLEIIKPHRVCKSTQEQPKVRRNCHIRKQLSLEIVEEEWTEELYESASTTTEDD